MNWYKNVILFPFSFKWTFYFQEQLKEAEAALEAAKSQGSELDDLEHQQKEELAKLQADIKELKAKIKTFDNQILIAQAKVSIRCFACWNSLLYYQILAGYLMPW